ncbi:MAG: DNA cytosine methyltransferase, partial [Prevotella sp.]|nr:DNA cytosine methyltransferase [Prevotella sp.]
EKRYKRLRIRKLTPRECFRLMDVDEHYIDTIQAVGISKSQQYKLAGNSIVVNCM